MKIIKRDGSEMEFDRSKIEAAVQKANESVDADDRLNRQQIAEIAQRVEEYCHTMKRAMSVEEIQDQVEQQRKLQVQPVQGVCGKCRHREAEGDYG